jgi:hypothetical protein
MTKSLMHSLLGTALAATLALSAMPAMAQAEFSAAFADPAWDGATVPEGQHCPLQGGSGATPAIDVSGLPAGTTQVNLSFNDETYEPMNNGGHGVLGFAVEAGATEVSLPSVPGATEEMPEGVTIAAENKTSGDFLTPGYMPPCSGGNGNTYSVDVIALDAAGAELGRERLQMGTY